MMHTTIDTPDVQLAKLLIARKLKDDGIDMAPEKIVATFKSETGRDTRIRFRYPAAKVRVTVQSVVSDSDELTFADIVELVEEQASSYQRMLDYHDVLEEIIAETKVAAKREIAKAKRRGLAWKLLDIQPPTVEAGSNPVPSVEVTIEMLSAALVPNRYSVVAQYGEAIVSDLTDERVVLSQTVRSVRKNWFDGVGAAGAIDAVALTALRSSGQDVPAVIRRMRESENGFVLHCDDLSLTLRWADGLIKGSFAITDQISYTDSSLSLRGPEKPASTLGLSGKPASVIVESPLLEGAVVIDAADSAGISKVTLEPRFHVFDAETLEPRDQLFPL
ncbi:hypothetical protein HMP09_1907 [Sphingomonas sp. HMP9]|uniref:hypothetical protein n=1 Tax=Sphingomonas sp. HMP9 TaxID=1517554 RepID=UPI001596F46E|nr:hypothetical protein [Sphingomonas sp. HMP9]BCA62673.1 hypothetical protein HMP09_1907 [Sphingomonas sp. HMP9]